MEQERLENIKSHLGMGDEINHQQDDGIVKFEGSDHGKKSKKGSVQIEETQDENGMQRKVVRDLGNGRKSVEITRVIKRNKGKGKFILNNQ